ncbi:TonB-dependent receptor [Pseudoalteromonas sp. T1lg65]|uniref:TonB-dependent receptor n=1 Tax=Pseudoalteromonas sp. T1lg65 TaxID=2077101 RepID=UPI003F799E7B
MKAMKRSALATVIHATLFSAVAGTSLSVVAEEQQQEAKAKSNQLEIIQITARKRVENAQEVPVSVSALQGDGLNAYSSAGMDIRFMNAKIPSLTVESSFGRSFPRFYVRGLGNTDFDLNASQPVSLVVDEVVQENPILKGFPVFDIGRVEVLRGPQGTLFGRNTPAGLVKFDTVKPSQDFDAYGSVSYGSRGAVDFEGAVGGSLTDKISTRVSVQVQDKEDFIDTKAPGFEKKNSLGGYNDVAARVQFLYEGDDFTGLLKYRVRDLEGRPIPFRGNLIKPGTNDFVDGYAHDEVYHDAASRATQQVDTEGLSLRLEWDLAEHTVTSITAWESVEIYSRADIDGSYAAIVPGSAESADGIPDHEQLTQELRLSSNFSGDLNYQVGVFFFEEDLTIETFGFNTTAWDEANQQYGAQNGYVIQNQDTSAWAVFGSVDYTFTDKLKVTAGLRYSDDEKEFDAERTMSPIGGGTFKGAVNPSDEHISWDLSAAYKYSDDINLFARVANGFRAPSIQGRVLYGNEITVADSETVMSYEFGVKSDVLDGQGRVNATVYYFEMDDQQLTAVGGGANFNRLLNADKTTGYGLELDTEWVLTDNLNATFNLSYNENEIDSAGLEVGACGAACTITDPYRQTANPFAADGDGKDEIAAIDGNRLPNSPKWIANLTLRYSQEFADGELFAYTDFSYRSKINFFLYESVEFTGDALFEGGVRGGYAWTSGDNEYEASLFVRNIFDEQKVIGGIDFNNLTGMVNEERFVGAEFKVKFF